MVYLAHIAVVFLFLTGAMQFAYAKSPPLELSGPVGANDIGAHIDFLLDENHNYGLSDVTGALADEFKPIQTRIPDFGYTPAIVWLRLKVVNRTGQNMSWRLYFHENFKQIFHVYIVNGDGEATHALDQELDSPFSTRVIAFPEIVVPFETGLGEGATLFIRFWTEGSTILPMSIETVESFTATSSRKSAKNFIFYGMMLILIVAALLAMLVLRQPIFLAYVAYATSTLLYLMHADGVAFQYLWPDFPLFNSFASVVTGAAFVIFGSHFARVFLNTSLHHPVIDKILLGIIVFTVLMVLSSIVIETSLIKKTLILVALSSLVVFTISGLVAARRGFKPVRFYVFAWLGASASALLMTIRHWFGVEISQEFQYDSMRVVMVFDAVMMGMAIIDRYSQLRVERQSALQSSLANANLNLDMTNRLRDLESRYELAAQTAANRDRQLEHTIHDLRQPLHALRLAVHGAISNGLEKNGGYGEINDSFNYLETLVTSQLDRALARHEGRAEDRESSKVEDMTLNDVLRSIHEMFLPDASAKKLSFVYVPTSVTVSFEPLVVMRIMTNLVSNAIKYTSEGKILIGVRRRRNAFCVEIHDTGPGLSAEEFAAACKRSVRLAKSRNDADGHGFGLAIVLDLAKRHGYTVRLLENRRTGAGLQVEISRCHQAAGTNSGASSGVGVGVPPD